MKKKLIIMLAVMALFATVAAFAQEAAPKPATPPSTANAPATEVKWGVMSAAFVLAISAAAGAIGQGRAVAAAVEGIARNPSAAGPIRLAMIIGLALIESLVIYALVLSFALLFKYSL